MLFIIGDTFSACAMAYHLAKFKSWGAPTRPRPRIDILLNRLLIFCVATGALTSCVLLARSPFSGACAVVRCLIVITMTDALAHRLVDVIALVFVRSFYFLLPRRHSWIPHLNPFLAPPPLDGDTTTKLDVSERHSHPDTTYVSPVPPFSSMLTPPCSVRQLAPRIVSPPSPLHVPFSIAHPEISLNIRNATSRAYQYSAETPIELAAVSLRFARPSDLSSDSGDLGLGDPGVRGHRRLDIRDVRFPCFFSPLLLVTHLVLSARQDGCRVVADDRGCEQNATSSVVYTIVSVSLFYSSVAWTSFTLDRALPRIPSPARYPL